MYKRDVKELRNDKNKWKELDTDRSKWRSYLQVTLKIGEKKITTLENKRRLKKEKLNTANIAFANTVTNQTINNIVTNGLDP